MSPRGLLGWTPPRSPRCENKRICVLRGKWLLGNSQFGFKSTAVIWGQPFSYWGERDSPIPWIWVGGWGSLPPIPAGQGKSIGFCPDAWLPLARPSDVEREMKTLRSHSAFMSWWRQQHAAEVMASGHRQRCPAVAVSRDALQASLSRAFACSPATQPPSAPVRFPSPQLWALLNSISHPITASLFFFFFFLKLATVDFYCSLPSKC